MQDQGVGELKDRVVHINRVTMVVKGGKNFSFAALVLVGDGNGWVGDIKATVILPVNTEKELIGFVGFDSVVAVDPWHEEDIALLHITAEIIRNAVARKHSEALINYMAYHDTLTGLPNRNLFQDRLKVALVHAQRHKRTVAVMIIDLDQFKTVNDVLGHHIGDLLLKEIAGRLTHCGRKGDTIARTGGDEFTIILPDLIHALNTIIVASKIIDALNQTFRLEGRPAVRRGRCRAAGSG